MLVIVLFYIYKYCVFFIKSEIFRQSARSLPPTADANGTTQQTEDKLIGVYCIHWVHSRL